MKSLDLAALRKDADGFRGRFEFAARDDDAELSDRLVYTSEDGNHEPYVIAEQIDQHIAEPMARMLNATPALLDELQRIRDVIDSFPPIIAAVITRAIDENLPASIDAQAFIDDVLKRTQAHVMKTRIKRRGRGK